MEERATFAGGCFWCIESAFQSQWGVLQARSGYMGGTTSHPTYEQVCQGGSGHYEAVEVLFDPQQVTYLQLLDIFWHHIDPTDAGGQFFDRGSQYQTVIFFHNARQKQLAEQSKKFIQNFFEAEIKTQILEAKTFYPAEEHHQGYCTKQPLHYQSYQRGHEERLKDLWEDKRGDIYSAHLKEKLTPIQYEVTQNAGTEPPFQNPYWNHQERGLYVDIVSGDPLFTSEDKFDSHCGWPSFAQPLDKESLKYIKDISHGMERIEVRSQITGSHLGHVFTDGPLPHGTRYCINSAALRFIPYEKLSEEGYGDYLEIFENS